jgi:hypothetical protein
MSGGHEWTSTHQCRTGRADVHSHSGQKRHAQRAEPAGRYPTLGPCDGQRAVEPPSSGHARPPSTWPDPSGAAGVDGAGGTARRSPHPLPAVGVRWTRAPPVFTADPARRASVSQHPWLSASPAGRGSPGGASRHCRDETRARTSRARRRNQYRPGARCVHRHPAWREPRQRGLRPAQVCSRSYADTNHKPGTANRQAPARDHRHS